MVIIEIVFFSLAQSNVNDLFIEYRFIASVCLFLKILSLMFYETVKIIVKIRCKVQTHGIFFFINTQNHKYKVTG